LELRVQRPKFRFAEQLQLDQKLHGAGLAGLLEALHLIELPIGPEP
jgi:hypothetical protein